MVIQRLTFKDRCLVEKCDTLFLEFLDSEGQYDYNYLKREKVNSFINDLTDDNNILLAAIDENNVLGFLYGCVEKKKAGKLPVAHMSFIYVYKDYRNRKLATNLIDNFFIELKNKNVEIVEVKCFENNEIAKKLYNKYGFDVLWSNYRKKLE